MIRWSLVLAIFLALPWHITFAEESVGSKGNVTIAQRLVDNVYRPFHDEFALSSAQWAIDVADMCLRRPTSSTYRMQVRFTDLIETYAAVELFRIGPLLDDNLQSRLFYWPDKRRVGERQLRALLASIDEQAITVEQLAGKSVAVQGFTALERLLFNTSLLPVEQTPQCLFIPVVVENIANMARQLDSAWKSDSAFVQSFLSPHPDSRYYRTSTEVSRSVYTQIKVGLDIVLDAKLKPLLSNDRNTMRQTPMWISQRTVAMLTGNLRALRALLLDSGILDGTSFAEELQIEFDYIDHVLLELKPIVYFLESDETLNPLVRVLMNKLAAVVADIRYTLDNEVSRAVGMSAGFNSQDGD